MEMPTLDKQRPVTAYAQLVKRIAYQLAARLPTSVQVDDLIQAGMIGLLDAMGHYDETQGAQFETYATQRIRGAMLDELREIDWAPRSVRKNARDIEHAVSALEQRLSQPPNEQQIADKLGVTLDEYQQMLGDARGHQLLYYEDFQDADGDSVEFNTADSRPGPLEALQDEGLRATLIKGIGELPEREKLVMAMYYQEELNLKEIGAVLGVSESRVCQLHSQAIIRLRGKMTGWVG
ncbi:MAG: RNA polymerase sigma factor FliA [Nitrosomonadales bacterium]|jgi:RNA polymerase sigma factor for flagellar operon FliA|nr:MAG: RNA polymerase sigma factor FliA [Nitrosomonadales bacterium]